MIFVLFSFLLWSIWILIFKHLGWTDNEDCLFVLLPRTYPVKLSIVDQPLSTSGFRKERENERKRNSWLEINSFIHNFLFQWFMIVQTGAGMNLFHHLLLFLEQQHLIYRRQQGEIFFHIICIQFIVPLNLLRLLPLLLLLYLLLLRLQTHRYRFVNSLFLFFSFFLKKLLFKYFFLFFLLSVFPLSPTQRCDWSRPILYLGWPAPSTEESRIFSEIQRMMDDSHPDAHACRIKLWLLIGETNVSMGVVWVFFFFFFSWFLFCFSFQGCDCGDGKLSAKRAPCFSELSPKFGWTGSYILKSEKRRKKRKKSINFEKRKPVLDRFASLPPIMSQRRKLIRKMKLWKKKENPKELNGEGDLDDRDDGALGIWPLFSSCCDGFFFNFILLFYFSILFLIFVIFLAMPSTSSFLLLSSLQIAWAFTNLRHDIQIILNPQNNSRKILLSLLHTPIPKRDYLLTKRRPSKRWENKRGK